MLNHRFATHAFLFARALKRYGRDVGGLTNIPSVILNIKERFQPMEEAGGSLFSSERPKLILLVCPYYEVSALFGSVMLSNYRQ